jgi:ATP-dependent Clp protease protease subunit
MNSINFNKKIMENYSNIDYYGEFNKFACRHLGVSQMQLNAWEQIQTRLYTQASMTPYILEERELRVTQMDIFSRLMMDRILWVAGVVNDAMSTVVQAQLMFLDNLDSVRDITMHIDTPGGSVKSGLSMIDTMDYVRPDIITVNTGMAASMGSLVLGAGTKGKRFSLPSSRVMLHQVSSGAEGNVQDMRISLIETEKLNTELFERLGSYCGKTAEVVLEDTKRDLWLTSKEAIEYGIIDSIITKRQ